MLLSRDRTMGPDGGFTLIELLIVVVIIGILTAIAIPQFSSTKEKSYNAASQSDLRNLLTAQETYFAAYGEYATDLSTLDADTRFNPTTGVNISMNRLSASSFRADASHDRSSSCFWVEMGSGATQKILHVGEAGSGGGNCRG